MDWIWAIGGTGFGRSIDALRSRRGSRVQDDEANLIWTPATAMPPSPTAAAQRFSDPERTSPAAKIPGKLV